MEELFMFFLANLQDFFVGGVIVASTTIVLMGFLKKFVFNRIANKLVRKCALSFSSLAVCLVVTFCFLIGNGLDAKCFFFVYAANAISTIITYWFYENTGLRNLIVFVGDKTIKKYIGIAYNVINGADANTTKAKLIEANSYLKSTVKKEIKAKKDKGEFKDL